MYLTNLPVSLLLCAVAAVADSRTAGPTATVKNGTYVGLFNAHFNQDMFLGIPYAQPPLGELRLNNPMSLNESFSGTRNATNYPFHCIGYGGDDIGYPESEDCLGLNVIRPANAGSAPLPVAVWIHGGGYVMGGSADKRYNLTFIVQNSAELGKPIIGVSLNYRLSGWGFLAGTVIQDAGVTNLGLKDMRLALHWLQENIAAFGGDPTKVTIWGESAGGGAVGYMAQAFDGRDDHLFRGIMAESLYESEVSANVPLANQQFDNITTAAGCGAAADKLACLRSISFDALNTALNITPAYAFAPVVDGDIVTDLSSKLLAAGKFTKTPLLIGANSDEGTAFSPQGINTDAEFAASIAVNGPDANTTSIFEILYPDIPSIGIPATFTTRPSDPSVGVQFKRSAAFAGDNIIIAPRRLRNEAWSAQNVSSYAYRFNVIVNGVPDFIAVTHFQEVAFVFNNLQGLGYAVNPFANEPASFAKLSKLMSNMWVSFVHDLTPNNHGISGIPEWPIYNALNGYGQNFVFDANVTSHPELDTFRAEAIAFMNSVAATQLHR